VQGGLRKIHFDNSAASLDEDGDVLPDDVLELAGPISIVDEIGTTSDDENV
jgi:hypothetical protein